MYKSLWTILNNLRYKRSAEKEQEEEEEEKGRWLYNEGLALRQQLIIIRCSQNFHTKKLVISIPKHSKQAPDSILHHGPTLSFVATGYLHYSRSFSTVESTIITKRQTLYFYGQPTGLLPHRLAFLLGVLGGGWAVVE